ncbi:Putative hydrolase in cluster with formaldehyde/S-nitrosomycothiol reductase MscR [[Actinomadura] parvosata subsp. kistnae]|uniref:Zn-dependent hydrolase n=2 Tax=Nonomuraea TaxID=83681 RepID=A0A1V0A8X5_9ACTN|nr:MULTISPECIES: MBL fold metallo-hydrolase [unclassified Nonomuraea]AQZ66657.1 Zn-dependent hydrolase [Nonomuraea sp. ATCC 55076]NJP93176.1 MBL fold metallo-hydrolase [Nonomuraea sp. FMUSA5-5]SPL95239.1 Putative hydrolase in cluster with formaldehyde/S-nitrosomycothiol reductase MscR [Actinomadura parvosata subsp. kistnae]
MIDRVITSGTFSLDGGTWDVDNNIWLVGDAREVVVIDAAHDAAAIAERVGGRTVRAILCTHAHNDHINAARDLAALTGAPIRLHPADQVLWEQVYGPEVAYEPLADGEKLAAGGVTLEIRHTPGHAPGAVCVYAPELGAVFSGDTLFKGGPGATGRSFSSFETIIESIRERLLTLPPETVVHTGHGDSTAIGAEAPHLEEWIARGH